MEIFSCMTSKFVRRRAVLVLLVVISLSLLTDYFGESPNSPLHSIQRGIATVLSPLQSGASTVLSPVRDVAGYISSTVNAKSQLKHYKSENATLKEELAVAQLQANQYKQADSIGTLDTNYSLQSYGLKTANVIGEDPIALVQDDHGRRGQRRGCQAVRPGRRLRAASSATSLRSCPTSRSSR